MIAAYTEGDEPVPGFRLAKLLACETFGSVWKATGPGGMEACVKIVSLVNKQRLKEFSALRLVKHVRHPNLVPILAFWLKDKQGNFIDENFVEDADSLLTNPVDLIMVMGLGDKSLFDRLKEVQKEGLPGLAPRELLSYMEDVAEALDHLNHPVHDLGSGPVAIQHCDIKPQNILIVGSAAQVCDLGGARMVADARATSAVGSAAYMAPEYITEGTPSKATDQYSLAVCYVELRTGSLPLNARSAAAAYLTHIRGALDLTLLPAAERAVIARATSVRAENRYPACRTLVNALKEACGLTGPMGPPDKASSSPNINMLARRNGTHTPPPESPRRPEGPVPLVPPEKENDEEPSDESVNLAGPKPREENDTFAEGMSLVSRAQALSFPPREALERTAVVDVHVLPHPSTVTDDDEVWPTELEAALKTQTSLPRPPADTEPIPTPVTVPTPCPESPPSRAGDGSQAPESRELPCEPVRPMARRRRWLPVPVAIACSAVLGLFGSWLARNPASADLPAANTSTEVATAAPAEHHAQPPAPTAAMPRAEADERPGEHPVEPPVRTVERVRTQVPVAAPFALQGTGRGFTTLAAALEAASAGDTILVQSNGPFVTGPLELHGKELTIKAATGLRPLLQLMGGGPNTAWRPLLTSDRALVLEGLELRRPTTNTSAPAHLVTTERAPLRLVGCRLEVPLGCAAVVCRNPGMVEVRDCTILAEALGICVEVGDGSPCDIRMVGNDVRIQEATGAAFSVWAPEVQQSSAVRLFLERNVVSAGRVVAFKALPRGLEVEARGNDFTFREALVSFVGYSGPEGWQHATIWREHENRYHGPAEWLRVNGRPAGVHGLDSWRALWAGAEVSAARKN